jgi:xylulokinase
LSGGLAEELGLPTGIPVAAGGGDNAAAAVGTGLVREGLVSSSVGTSGVVFAHTEEFRADPSGRIHAFCHSVPGKFHQMGVTLSAGGSLSWWAREVLGEADFSRLTGAAEKIFPGSEGLLFLPYLMGERTPHLDPAARGTFLGLTTRHTKAHMTRALMEGVVFSLRDALQIMRDLGTPLEQVRATGGGARSGLWRQLQADIYGLPIHRITVEEGPAYGAALLGGVAAGVFRDVEEASSLVMLREEATEPNPEAQKTYEALFEVYRDLYPATKETMHRLTRLADETHE